MKIRFLLAIGALAALVSAHASAEEAAAATPIPTPATELKALVDQINAKIDKDKKTAADLAPEIAAFDALLAKYKGRKTDEVAEIAFIKASLYLAVLQDEAKGLALLKQAQADFPGTKTAAKIASALASMELATKAAQTQSALIGKPAPELHFKWTPIEGLKTLSALKGNVVVLDFWTTGCTPYLFSLPQVRELDAHYKEADVIVVGVTSIQGRVANLEETPIDTKGDPAKEIALMSDFIKANQMTWMVAISEEPVTNPDYGVTSIPYRVIIAPDGTVRHAGLRPASPLEEQTAKIDPILKEFGMKVPASAPKP